MAEWLQWLSALMPFTYAYEALSRAASSQPLDAGFAVDVAVVICVTLAALGLGAATLRRRTP
jgi:ABC-2 type transport system permease protein